MGGLDKTAPLRLGARLRGEMVKRGENPLVRCLKRRDYGGVTEQKYPSGNSRFGTKTVALEHFWISFDTIGL
ncbi:hypothetical protein ACINB_34210 [Acidovorax sp. NB1]|jgi:hypothetical protein|nr:hypothetical protein ACINB_34210 [Acidovorax sp. NB1]